MKQVKSSNKSKLKPKNLRFKDKSRDLQTPSSSTEKDAAQLADQIATAASGPNPNKLSTGTNGNHPDWYDGNPILTASLGLLNFSNFKGASNQLLLGMVDWEASTGTRYYNYLPVTNRFPGILTHHFSHTFGALASVGNDAEEMGRMIYANIRRAISGRRTYDAGAVLQYILAIGSLQAAISELHRVLAAANTRNISNKYLGERLVEALGYDYDDIAGNYNEYLSRVNFLAIKTRGLVLPKGIRLFEKWQWMTSSVFADKDDVRAGLIAFIPQGFWAFGKILPYFESQGNLTEFESNLKSYGFKNSTISNVQAEVIKNQPIEQSVAPFGLIYQNFADFIPGDPTKERFSKILTLLESTAYTYTDNHDFNLIGADLLKAYGDDIHVIKEFESGTQLNISYNLDVITASKNITYVPFKPIAVAEFPNLSLKSQANLNAMVYVMDAYGVNPQIMTADDVNLVKPKVWYPHTFYAYSHKELLSGKEAMSALKWTVRYTATDQYKDGNVILINRQSPGRIMPDAGLKIEAMGTEVIHSSVVWTIDDAFDAVVKRGIPQTTLTPDITKFGMRPIIWGFANIIELPRYSARDTHVTESARTLAWETFVIHRLALDFITHAMEWDSCPMMYILKPGGFLRKSGEGSTLEGISYSQNLIAINPAPHYTIIGPEALARHHEVALASVLGIGNWGPGSINSLRSEPGSSLSESAFEKRSS